MYCHHSAMEGPTLQTSLLITSSLHSLKLLSWNVRGLNSWIKRALVFNYIQKHKPHVIFLQETHLVGSKMMALQRTFVKYAFHSTYSNYARGVSVLVTKSLICTLDDVGTDHFVRFIIVILVIDKTPYTFVAIYVPPPFTVELWDTVMAKVLQVAKGPIIIAGDLNAVLSPEIDRFQTVSKCASSLVMCAEQYQLVEVWSWKNADA